MRFVFASILLTSATVVAGVGCGGKVGGGPCDGDNADPICDQACGADNPCPAGFFCEADGTCTADCTQAGDGCEGGQICTPDGECVAQVDADCPNVTLSGERTTPVVQLLLDQSGSMTGDFGNTDRWNAMESALIDAMNGAVTTTDDDVIFGASLYTYNTDNDNTCPRLTTVARSLDNRDAIAQLLASNGPDGETPTGDSIDVVVNDFMANPVSPAQTPIILLATDGEPDTCEQPNPQNGQAEAIAAATRAFQNGIRLYILGVGSDVGAPHLQDMANAGVGAPAGTNAPYYQADNPAELAAALESLISGVVSCELNLDGVIDPSQAASGTVTLNGQEIEMNVGWELVDGDTIRLIGAACDSLLASAAPVVNATFPCGVVVD